ncbi:hypothetical protein BS650_19800 [Aeromonas hydrophila]|nr:hypothetical protein AS145_21970 [Aeromonas hydrophila]ALZ82487.1 hypothetical protein AhyD4_21800 [Aeromonas hydrophila]ANS02336.1 hypothetical protein A9258_20935 [Aeromonas hydrophila]AXV32397.1 hypothetical protein BFW97_21930 [Aeromonas hydrophila]KYQ05959.1 hypothetical protein AW872_20415 [Aeromonas hydrophila]
MTGRSLHGSGKHTHIQDRPIKVRMTIHKDMMRRGITTDRVICSQGWDSHKHIKAASAAFFLLGH